MGYARNVGKYELRWTVGEGAFAKVKLAKNITNGKNVAIKIIDKHMVVANNLMYQVQREIKAMRLLNHPKIVRIHEVIGTKTKIYIVMEYVPGGQLSDKLSYAKPLSEKEVRKYFHQLIDAVEYCHSRGVYHRDLKPENLLLDRKGDLKLSDFGLSTSRKPGSLLLTTCGSPSYVAPELLNNKGYEGAGADIWACGVILFEMLAGYLPFDDINLLSLYRKIWRAEYECPKWFTVSQKKLIGRILNPVATKRITIAEIMEDEWFQIDYEQKFEGMDNAKHIQAALEFLEESAVNKIIPQTPRFINAFQLIAMLHEHELSGMFEEQEDDKNRIIIGSNYTTSETIQRIEAAAKKARLSAERINNSKIKMQLKLKSKRSSFFDLLAEVTEVAPTVCIVEISKSSVGELNMYQEFCESLSSLLTEETSKPLTEWSV